MKTVTQTNRLGVWAKSDADGLSSLLKNSAGCDVAWMRRQNNDVSRYFASRAELSSAPGEVEKCHDATMAFFNRLQGIPPKHREILSYIYDAGAGLPIADAVSQLSGKATLNGIFDH